MQKKRGVWREFFQWFNLESLQKGALGYLGKTGVDEFDFFDVARLGPGIVYQRALPFTGMDELVDYFAGNSAGGIVPVDQASGEGGRRVRWPSDEEFAVGFRQIYGQDFFQHLADRRDPIWESAAERRYTWVNLRTIAVDGDQYFELIVWLAYSVRISKLDRIAAAREYVVSQGFELTGLYELFDTHCLIPQSGMIVFEIRRESKLTDAEYRARYLLAGS